jgi:hypothetical protein
MRFDVDVRVIAFNAKRVIQFDTPQTRLDGVDHAWDAENRDQSRAAGDLNTFALWAETR